MTKKDLLKNLSNFKTIQPQNEWKKGLRSSLLVQLQSQTSSGEAGFFIAKESTTTLIHHFIFGRILQPAVLTMALIGFIGINSLGLALAKNSLPGSFLYHYKTANENIVLSLIQTPERKISLKSSFANQRLIEFNQLAKMGEEEKTFLSVNNFQENLNDISISFSQIGQEGKTEDLVKLAFILDAQTAEYEKILNQTKEEISLSKETREKVKTALDKSDQTGTQALKVVIREYENQETEAVKDKLALRLKEKIERTENNLIDSGDLPIQDDRMAEEARKSLIEAREYLAEGSFSMALDKIEESKKIASFSNFSETVEGEQNSEEEVVDAPSEAVSDNEEQEAGGEEEILKPIIKVNQYIILEKEVKTQEDYKKNTGDFQTDLIKDNKEEEGFFGGLIKSRK